jgi:ABC-type hemin transport system substrate-binding protein
MPLEGHWKKQNTPLRRLAPRERKVGIVVLAVTLAAMVAVIVAAGTSYTRSGPEPGCIRVVVAGKTGGEVVAACGAEARVTCTHSARFDDPRSRDVVANCRRAGILE